MTSKEHLKKELILYALKNDFFSYGTLVKKWKNGKYHVYAEEGPYTFTAKDLVYQWDQLDNKTREDILNAYFEDELKGEEYAD